MIKINNVQLKHGGILGNGSAKLILYLPECTADQHAEVVKMAMEKIVGVILVEPDKLDLIAQAVNQIIDLDVTSEQPPIDPIIQKDGGEEVSEDSIKQWDDEGEF